MIVCGIDEAGRGSFIGPMVIAGVAIDESRLGVLCQAGVRDSKVLTADARERLYHTVLEHCTSYTVRRCHPSTIDNSVLFHGLTDLEITKMADIIRHISADAYYVDSCYSDAAQFGKRLRDLTRNTHIHSHIDADSKFVVVAAASIIAKVLRDRAIQKIQKKHPVGSGYPADSETIRYVREAYLATGRMPLFVRKSWSTMRRVHGDQRFVA